MASFGELIPGRKVHKDDLGEKATGEPEDRGPLDLSRGVVQLRRRAPETPAPQRPADPD
jgi:hypothetical protein